MFLLGILIIIAVVYFAARPNHRISLDAPRYTDAEEILKKRFVNGEIDEETYKKMLQTLRSN
jgi:uncharacterized membrane protein